MDPIFDRLGNLLKSLFQDESGTEGARASAGGSADPDMREAWEELDEFLKTGKEQQKQSERPRRQTASRPGSSHAEHLPEELRQDYANLEVAFGAPQEDVRKSYKRLIRQYHPDRHTGDPKRLKYATEITQKINQSYQRIRKYAETGKL